MHYLSHTIVDGGGGGGNNDDDSYNSKGDDNLGDRLRIIEKF